MSGGDGGESGGTPDPQQSRDDKAMARDAAVRKVLLRSTTSLAAAVGLPFGSNSADVVARSRKLLRLLHPDYVINLPLKGTKRRSSIKSVDSQRIEARLAVGTKGPEGYPEIADASGSR